MSFDARKHVPRGLYHTAASTRCTALPCEYRNGRMYLKARVMAQTMARFKLGPDRVRTCICRSPHHTYEGSKISTNSELEVRSSNTTICKEKIMLPRCETGIVIVIETQHNKQSTHRSQHVCCWEQALGAKTASLKKTRPQPPSSILCCCCLIHVRVRANHRSWQPQHQQNERRQLAQTTFNFGFILLEVLHYRTNIKQSSSKMMCYKNQYDTRTHSSSRERRGHSRIG